MVFLHMATNRPGLKRNAQGDNRRVGLSRKGKVSLDKYPFLKHLDV